MRNLVIDLAAFAGLGVSLLGIHQVFPPAALIVGGACVTALALTLAKKGGTS